VGCLLALDLRVVGCLLGLDHDWASFSFPLLYSWAKMAFVISLILSSLLAHFSVFPYLFLQNKEYTKTHGID
jgi:hypothetical protein